MSKIRFHILLAALLVVTGCGEDDKVLPEQQQQFESFLSGSHQPRLVTEQEAMSSDEDLDFLLHVRALVVSIYLPLLRFGTSDAS